MIQRIDEYRQRWLEYWNSLTVRERLLLLVAGSALIVWIAYFSVIQPVYAAKMRAETRLEANVKNYKEVSALASEIKQLQKRSSQKDKKTTLPLDALVSSTARAIGISVAGLTQQQSSLQVRLETVEFSKVLKWLKVLQRQGVSIESLDVSKSETEGKVNVRQLRLSETG